MLERSWLDNAAGSMKDTMIGTLGLEMVTVTPDHVLVRMPYALALTSLGGAVHSGALVGLAETAAYLAILNHESYVGPHLPALVASSLRCLGPASDDVIASASVVLRHERRVFVEVVLRSQLTPVAFVQSEFRLTP